MEFIAKVVASFLVGGGYVLAVVWLSEKLGHKIGAAIAGLPSTMLVGLIFIVLSSGADAGRGTLEIIPLMFTATLLYALVFIYSIQLIRWRHNQVTAIFLATLAWLLYSTLVKQLSEQPFALIVTIGILSLIGFWLAFRHFTPKSSNKTKTAHYLNVIRFISGGIIIASSVLAAKYLGPTWGGIVVSFPAMLAVILYFLYQSQGIAFLKGFLKSMPASYGSSLLFIIAAHQMLGDVWSGLAILIALLTSGIYAYLLVSFKPKAGLK